MKMQSSQQTSARSLPVLPSFCMKRLACTFSLSRSQGQEGGRKIREGVHPAVWLRRGYPYTQRLSFPISGSSAESVLNQVFLRSRRAAEFMQ
jgi:hypothetical protein